MTGMSKAGKSHYLENTKKSMDVFTLGTKLKELFYKVTELEGLASVLEAAKDEPTPFLQGRTPREGYNKLEQGFLTPYLGEDYVANQIVHDPKFIRSLKSERVTLVSDLGSVNQLVAFRRVCRDEDMMLLTIVSDNVPPPEGREVVTNPNAHDVVIVNNMDGDFVRDVDMAISDFMLR